MTKQEHDIANEGAKRYQKWRDEHFANPKFRGIYNEEAAKSELWIQLVEARRAAGLTKKEVAKRMGVSRSQVSHIERENYSHTPNTLRRYVKALGEGYSLEVRIHYPRTKDNE